MVAVDGPRLAGAARAAASVSRSTRSALCQVELGQVGVGPAALGQLGQQRAGTRPRPPARPGARRRRRSRRRGRRGRPRPPPGRARRGPPRRPPRTAGAGCRAARPARPRSCSGLSVGSSSAARSLTAISSSIQTRALLGEETRHERHHHHAVRVPHPSQHVVGNVARVVAQGARARVGEERGRGRRVQRGVHRASARRATGRPSRRAGCTRAPPRARTAARPPTPGSSVALSAHGVFRKWVRVRYRTPSACSIRSVPSEQSMLCPPSAPSSDGDAALAPVRSTSSAAVGQAEVGRGSARRCGAPGRSARGWPRTASSPASVPARTPTRTGRRRRRRAAGDVGVQRRRRTGRRRGRARRGRSRSAGAVAHGRSLWPSTTGEWDSSASRRAWIAGVMRRTLPTDPGTRRAGRSRGPPLRSMVELDSEVHVPAAAGHRPGPCPSPACPPPRPRW